MNKRSQWAIWMTSVLPAVPTGLVLATAAWLTPNPRGYGTHLQLGLGQCSFLHLTGFPCPMCGMTTTFALMAHGRFVAAALNQPFGVILFSLTLAVFCISVVELLKPGRAWSTVLRRLHTNEVKLALAFLVAMSLGWVYKIILVRGW